MNPWVAIIVRIYSSAAGEGIQAWGALNAWAAVARAQHGELCCAGALPVRYRFRYSGREEEMDSGSRGSGWQASKLMFQQQCRQSLTVAAVQVTCFFSPFCWIPLWYNTMSVLLCLEGEQIHAWWIKKREAQFSYVFQNIDCKNMSLCMLLTECTILNPVIVNNTVCYSETLNFYHQLSDELLWDFLNYFPISLPSITSILKSAFRHCH